MLSIDNKELRNKVKTSQVLECLPQQLIKASESLYLGRIRKGNLAQVTRLGNSLLKLSPRVFAELEGSKDFVQFLATNNAKEAIEICGKKYSPNLPSPSPRSMGFTEEQPVDNSFYSNIYWNLEQDDELPPLV